MSDDFEFPMAGLDTVPATVQGPDMPDLSLINPDYSTFQAPSLPVPSIMGGLDLSGGSLPMRMPSQSMPWTVQSDGLTPAMPSFGKGGPPSPPNQAKGIGTALDIGGTMVDAAHGVIRQAGQFMRADPAILGGLEHATTAITAPFAIGSGIAGTFSDIHSGVPVGTAILGNAARTGLVTGAGLLGGAVPIFGPVIGPIAAAAADHSLPDSTTIGRVLAQDLGIGPSS